MTHHTLGPWELYVRDPGREIATCQGCGATVIRGRGCLNRDARLSEPCGYVAPPGECGFLGPDWGQPEGPRFHRVTQANRAVSPAEYESLGSGARVQARRGVGGQRFE